MALMRKNYQHGLDAKKLTWSRCEKIINMVSKRKNYQQGLDAKKLSTWS